MLPGAGQAQAAVAQFDLEVGQGAVAVEDSTAAGAVGAAERRVAAGAVAADHRPAGGGQGGLQVGRQVGHAGVVGRGAGAEGHGRFNCIADLVDLHHQGHIAAQLAVARHGPAVKGQFVDIERGQQVDAARCVEVDRAVGAAGGDAGGAIKHQTATLVGGSHGGGAAVEAALEVDALAGCDVGADDQLTIGLHRDPGVDVVAHEAAAEEAAGAVAHHLAAAAGQQQALHVHIIDTAQADLAGRSHAGIAVAGALHHQLGTGLHDQPLAAAVAAALHLDEAAGMEEPSRLHRLPRLVAGGAPHEHPPAGADGQIRIATTPIHGLAEQVAAAVKGLPQPATGDQGADQFHPPGGGDAHRAAIAVEAIAAQAPPQPGSGDPAAAVDQQAEGIAALAGCKAHRGAIPVVVLAGGAAAEADVAAGQQARLHPQLFAGADCKAAAAIAIGIDGEGHPLRGDPAARHQGGVELHIQGAAQVDGAAGLAGAQGAGGMHIDAGAAAVGAGAVAPQHQPRVAQAAVEPEAVAGGGETLHIQPFIGVKPEA